MSTLAEIEAAIERLPDPQVEQLARWLEQRRARTGNRTGVEAWIARAVGAAKPGVTSDEILAATRGAP